MPAMLLMAAGDYHVVTSCAQLTHDLLAIANFLVEPPCRRHAKASAAVVGYGKGLRRLSAIH